MSSQISSLENSYQWLRVLSSEPAGVALTLASWGGPALLAPGSDFVSSDLEGRPTLWNQELVASPARPVPLGPGGNSSRTGLCTHGSALKVIFPSFPPVSVPFSPGW